MNSLVGLFALSILAATLFPIGSEAMLLLLASEQESIFWLWLVATSGNTLGSVINYVLGRYLLHFQNRRWFPFKTQRLQQSQAWFNQYGKWSLLIAWLPIVGDALTFIAGTMRTHFGLFLLLVSTGKALRYGFLLGALHVWQNIA